MSTKERKQIISAMTRKFAELAAVSHTAIAYATPTTANEPFKVPFTVIFDNKRKVQAAFNMQTGKFRFGEGPNALDDLETLQGIVSVFAKRMDTGNPQIDEMAILEGFIRSGAQPMVVGVVHYESQSLMSLCVSEKAKRQISASLKVNPTIVVKGQP